MDETNVRGYAAMEILNNPRIRATVIRKLVTSSDLEDADMFTFGVAMAVACIFESFANCPSDAMKMLVGQSLEKEGE